MKRILMTTGIAMLALATIAGAQSYAFNTNLTVGSTGPDVVALQTWLIQNGYHIPSVESGAAAKGYFGSQTKAAARMYQSANGIPSTGFVGPLTRAALNGSASGSMGGASNCMAGWTSILYQGTNTCLPPGYQAPAGATTPVTGGTQSNGSITTPGIQGIMSVTQGPISNSTAYVGSQKVPILAVRVQAQYSDLSVQTIQLDLGSSTNIYNFIYSKLYVIDPSNGNVLASVPLNSSTVVQSGSQYIVGINGLNFIVPKGGYKDLQIAADLYNSVDSTNRVTWYVNLDNNGVRAVDGAGVNLYGPTGGTPVVSNGGFSGGFGQGISINQSLVLTATATVTRDATSQISSSWGVQNTSTGQYLGLPVLTFGVYASGDELHLRTINVNFVASGNGSVTTAYLYNGSTPIMSSAVTSNGGNSYSATFSNIPDNTPASKIAANTTVPFTVKVDVTGLTAANSSETITASTSASQTIYNSMNSGVTVSGSATGDAQVVQGQGAVFSISGTPSITKSVSSTDQSGNSTTTYTATFNVVATAVGTNVTFGLPANASSGTVSFGTSTTGYNIAQLWVNGAAVSSSNALPAGNTQLGGAQGSLTASYSQPSNTTASGNTFVLGIGQTATIPVTYSFAIRNAAANTFAVQLTGIATSAGTSTFMSNLPTWRTPSI